MPQLGAGGVVDRRSRAPPRYLGKGFFQLGGIIMPKIAIGGQQHRAIGVMNRIVKLGRRSECAERDRNPADPRYREPGDRKSTRLNSSHYCASRMPSYA